MNYFLLGLWAGAATALLAILLLTCKRSSHDFAPLKVLREDTVGLVVLPDVPLWPDGPPGEKMDWHRWIGPEADKPYIDHPSEYRGMGIFNVTRPTLTPYLMPRSRGAVVVAPGGGYNDLCYSTEGLDVARRFNSMGLSVFLLKYRVPLRPPAPPLQWNWAALQDAQRAMGIVRGRAAEWHIDPHKIAFMGFSAGGHLSASIATAWQKRIYDRVDLFDDVSCRPDVSLMVYAWRLMFWNNPKALILSRELKPGATTPPTFIAGAWNDNMAWHEGWVLYDKLLREAKVESELHTYRSGGHGFAMCQTRVVKGDFCTWVESAQLFLQKHGILPRTPAAGARRG